MSAIIFSFYYKLEHPHFILKRSETFSSSISPLKELATAPDIDENDIVGNGRESILINRILKLTTLTTKRYHFMKLD